MPVSELLRHKTLKNSRIKQSAAKAAAWWKNLSPTLKGFIVIILICIIGIIIRWKFIVAGIAKGFGFYSGYAD